MAKVTRRDNETIERALSRLRRVVLRFGNVKQHKEKHRYFKKEPNRKMKRLKAAHRERIREEKFN